MKKLIFIAGVFAFIILIAAVVKIFLAQGDPEAQFERGYCYYMGKGVEQNKVEGVKWIRKAAKQGHAKAQSCLGAYYYFGEEDAGIPQDYTKAVEWWLKAAEGGSKNAQMSLGDCYKYGKGVPQDDIEAEKWYSKAHNEKEY